MLEREKRVIIEKHNQDIKNLNSRIDQIQRDKVVILKFICNNFHNLFIRLYF